MDQSRLVHMAQDSNFFNPELLNKNIYLGVYDITVCQEFCDFRICLGSFQAGNFYMTNQGHGDKAAAIHPGNGFKIIIFVNTDFEDIPGSKDIFLGMGVAGQEEERDTNTKDVQEKDVEKMSRCFWGGHLSVTWGREYFLGSA